MEEEEEREVKEGEWKEEGGEKVVEAWVMGEEEGRGSVWRRDEVTSEEKDLGGRM